MRGLAVIAQKYKLRIQASQRKAIPNTGHNNCCKYIRTMLAVLTHSYDVLRITHSINDMNY